MIKKVNKQHFTSEVFQGRGIENIEDNLEKGKYTRLLTSLLR